METRHITIEMIGGAVVARGNAKGTKRAKGDAPTSRRKGKAADAIPVEAATPSEKPQPTPSRRGREKASDAAPTEPASLNVVTPGHDTKLPEEPPEPTLADLAAGYLAHLEASGKSQGTVFSYRLELAVAMDELGRDTPVSQLTAECVKAFFESERVTKTRSGRTKSPLSIAKTTRVLRQAIGWGVSRGLADGAALT